MEKAKGKIKRNADVDKNAKEEMKRLKMQEKENKKKLAEKLKQLEPAECLKYLTTIIDSDLMDMKMGNVVTALESANMRYAIRKQNISRIITWTRKCPSDEYETCENALVLVWPCSQFINRVAEKNLIREVSAICSLYPTYSKTLMVCDIDEYFRKTKAKTNSAIRKGALESDTNNGPRKYKNREGSSVDSNTVSREDVDEVMAELQLMYGFAHRFVSSNGNELAQTICQYTKAVAETPYKLNRNKKYEETGDWYTCADSRDSVRVDVSGNGTSQLWLRQLCQFNNVGLEVAQAIVNAYKSPMALIKAYDQATSEKDKEQLLQNIQVRRTNGPLSSVRRVGPELSKKVCLLFNSSNGDLPLSQ